MKNIIGLLSIVVLITGTLLSAEKNEYDVRNIPDGLRKELNCVIRKYIDEYHILSSERSINHHTEAYTIFGADEKSNGELTIHYNSSFDEVDDIEGYIYDANGEEIKELDSDDILDISKFEGLYSDIRVKRASLFHNTFPYTVEFRYTVTHNGALQYPVWYARLTTSAVQVRRLTINVPAKIELRTWHSSDKINHEIINEGRNRIYKWEAVNQEELPSDAIGNIQDYSDFVLTGPTHFSIGGYDGNMKTWKDFGLWCYQLLSTRGELDHKAVEEIKKQYNESDDVIVKIKKLYRYMQTTTRYISIQLGIGGWQPLPASFVHEKGYGDCKALSNYMYSMLRVAGISAYPALIYRGKDNNCVVDFPCQQFNHMVLFIPLQNDTLWLECTSQTYPFNHLGYDNENRFALIVTPSGGEIVYTPVTSPNQNLQLRKSEVNISKDNSVLAEISVLRTGNQRDFYFDYIVSAPEDDRIKRVISEMNVPDVSINRYEFNDDKSISDTIILKVSAELRAYASRSGKRLFFYPNISARRKTAPKETETRLSPVRIGYPFLDVDTTVFFIPDGFKVESMPGEINSETFFGKYRAKCINEGNKIIYCRYYEISTYEVPAENYNEYRKFISDIVKSDRLQVVLIQN